jgi:hypothetical protein
MRTVSKNSFNLPPAFRPTWATVHEADAEAGARPQELFGDETGAVVDVHGAWHAAGRERGPKRCFETDGVLRQPQR